jgi:hypothetical protein
VELFVTTFVPEMKRGALPSNGVPGAPPDRRKIGGFVPAITNDSLGGSVLIVPKGSPPPEAGVFEFSEIITAPFVD